MTDPKATKEQIEKLGLCLKDKLQSEIDGGFMTEDQGLAFAALVALGFADYLPPNASDAEINDLGEKASVFSSLLFSVMRQGELPLDTFIKQFSKHGKTKLRFKELLDEISISDRFFKAPADLLRAAAPQRTRQVTAKKPDVITYPIDKVNSVVWNLAEIAEGETLKRNIRTSPKDSEKQTIVFYSIDFDALEKSEDVSITRQLTPYDKRVYTAISNLWMAGNEIISLSQIYHAMGNTSRPPGEEIRKINNSITKMRIAHIIVDNTKEHEVNNKYEVFKYDSSLLLFDRITATINGVITDAAIRVRGTPPLMEFALGRKQVSTCDPVMLQSPIKQTDANLRLEDYLLRRIMHMKNNARTTRKILFSTLFKSCEITTKMQRHRAPDKITALLDHYKKNGFIVGYIPANDGITIRL